MADTNNTSDEKGFLGLSKTAQKWIGIGLLVGGLGIGTYAIVKKSKCKDGKSLNGVKKSKKRIGKHTSGKKSKKSSRAKYLLKGF